MQYHNLNKKDISKELNEFSQYNLQLWENDKEKFITNIFIVTLTDENVLSKIWENLIAKIAFHYQSNLEKEIELWNIYVIFFIENQIEQKELKYKIENDHYCARKIVIDSVGNIKKDEDRIKSEINKKLFDLEIPTFTNPNNIQELEQEINELDSRLTQLDQIKKLIKEYRD
jgi:hypothetical protein